MLVIKIDKFERIKRRHLFVRIYLFNKQVGPTSFCLANRRRQKKSSGLYCSDRTHESEVQTLNVNSAENCIQCNIETKLVIPHWLYRRIERHSTRSNNSNLVNDSTECNLSPDEDVAKSLAFEVQSEQHLIGY